MTEGGVGLGAHCHHTCWPLMAMLLLGVVGWAGTAAQKWKGMGPRAERLRHVHKILASKGQACGMGVSVASPVCKPGVLAELTADTHRGACSDCVTLGGGSAGALHMPAGGTHFSPVVARSSKR